jgi:polar amino acid transport system substrate-binding protein
MKRVRWGASNSSRRLAVFSVAFLSAVLSLANGAEISAATLDRVRESTTIKLGYHTDARPFSYQDDTSKPAGYSVSLCEQIAEAVKEELGLATLTTQWVPVTLEDRFPAVKEGRVDLLCGADTVTLSRRKELAFSIPIFPGGIGAVLRDDAPNALKEVLSGQPITQPMWRGSPARILEKKTFSIVPGTTGETWLADRLDTLKIDAEVVPVDDYAAGIQRVLDGSSDVFFGERPILMVAAAASPSAADLIVLDRRFTFESLALGLARGDEDFRLVVDRALSRLFRSPDFSEFYHKWFGTPREEILTFFRTSAQPD